jgi:hypothetical protein
MEDASRQIEGAGPVLRCQRRQPEADRFLERPYQETLDVRALLLCSPGRRHHEEEHGVLEGIGGLRAQQRLDGSHQRGRGSRLSDGVARGEVGDDDPHALAEPPHALGLLGTPLLLLAFPLRPGFLLEPRPLLRQLGGLLLPLLGSLVQLFPGRAHQGDPCPDRGEQCAVRWDRTDQPSGVLEVSDLFAQLLVFERGSAERLKESVLTGGQAHLPQEEPGDQGEKDQYQHADHGSGRHPQPPPRLL